MTPPSPRVRRAVMFRHGAAYVERGGPAEGPLDLSFRRHEMNDALKSLAVWVASGNARVQSVAFDPPRPPEEALAERRLLLPETGALGGWLSALRGRPVRVRTAESAVEGRVIGTDGPPGSARLLLTSGAGALVLVPLASILELAALDGQSGLDMEFFLDKSRSAASGDRRNLRINLAGKAEDLRVACVIPSAPWKLSYRLLRQADATLLSGWALVHNPVDEDLDEIELTLSAAQPVSFLSELYEASGAVTQHQGDEPAVPVSATINEEMLQKPSGTIILDRPDPAPRAESFEYRVPHRVSLRRDGAAMVPVVGSSVAGRVERVWREGPEPHPDVALTFSNTTLSVLEEGPAVIYDRGNYVGEAMLSFTPRGEEVRLSYARDQAIRCRRSSRSSTAVLGVRLGAGAILEEQQREENHTFTVESEHLEELEVVIARPRPERRALVAEAGAVLEEGSAEVKLRLRAPPQGRTDASLSERWRETRRVEYEHLTAAELGGWLDARLIDRSTHDALASVLGAWAQAATFEEQRSRLEREQQDAIARHAKLREQIAVLGDSGQEGAIRLRFVKDMEREQDRSIACESELRKVRDAESQARRRAAQTLSVLAAHAERMRP